MRCDARTSVTFLITIGENIQLISHLVDGDFDVEHLPLYVDIDLLRGPQQLLLS